MANRSFEASKNDNVKSVHFNVWKINLLFKNDNIQKKKKKKKNDNIKVLVGM